MTPDEIHRWARPLVTAGLSTNGLDPSTEPATVVQACQGVGWLETRDGTAWSGAGAGSNNWGAIQSGRPPCPPETSFLYTDTHPNADGSSTPYSICFRKYASPASGAADLARVVYVRRPSVLSAARAGDLYGVSAALRATAYYEGSGKTIADRIARHYHALFAAVTAAARALGEPLPTAQPLPVPPPWQTDEIHQLVAFPLVMRGSYGRAVHAWQHDVLQPWLAAQGLAAIACDGAFGPITKRDTKLWQAAHQLVDDGKVGPITWAEALKAA